MLHIPPLSTLRDYARIWPHDDACARPAPLEPQGPEESDADFAAREKVHAQAVDLFDADFARAMETGDLAAILKPGAVPTKFTFRIVPGTVWRAFETVCVEQKLGGREIVALAFRLAVTKIEDPDAGVLADKEDHADPATGKRSRLGKVLASKYVDMLDAVSRSIVDELGDSAAQQRGAPLGK